MHAQSGPNIPPPWRMSVEERLGEIADILSSNECRSFGAHSGRVALQRLKNGHRVLACALGRRDVPQAELALLANQGY